MKLCKHRQFVRPAVSGARALCIAMAGALIAFGGHAGADSIVIDGVEYEDVYVRSSDNMYYVQLPDEGRVISVQRDRVDSGDVSIHPDEEHREALHREWEEAREARVDITGEDPAAEIRAEGERMREMREQVEAGEDPGQLFDEALPEAVDEPDMAPVDEAPAEEPIEIQHHGDRERHVMPPQPEDPEAPGMPGAPGPEQPGPGAPGMPQQQPGPGAPGMQPQQPGPGAPGMQPQQPGPGAPGMQPQQPGPEGPAPQQQPGGPDAPGDQPGFGGPPEEGPGGEAPE